MQQPTTSRRRLWLLTTTYLVEDGAGILVVQGRLGHATAAKLEAAADQLSSEGALDLVIDLSAVDYLSSAALRVVEKLAANRSAKGGRVTLRAPSVPVRLALELAGYSNLVTGPQR